MANKIKSIVLVPESQVYLELSFLADKEALSAYKERIARYGEKARETLDVFSYKNGLIQGSSPFAVVELASSMLALPSQLEHAVRLNPDYFRGTYEDIALVLRTNGDSYAPNDFIANHLAKQVKHRTGKEPTPECPARISLKGLGLEENGNSAYGIVFMLGDGAEVIRAQEFSHKNNGRKFSRTDERGVPIFNDKGSRPFYSRSNSGVSRLCLYRSLGLDFYDNDLSYSNADGRVVVCAEGAARSAQKNLAAVGAKEEPEDKLIAALELENIVAIINNPDLNREGMIKTITDKYRKRE